MLSKTLSAKMATPYSVGQILSNLWGFKMLFMLVCK